MRLRTSLKVVLAIIAVCAVVALSLSAWLTSSDSGKRWVADRLEKAVSKAIPGSLEIGRLLELGPPVVAQDVRFIHPDGRVVLHAKHASIVPDVTQAFQGRLAFESADVEGGKIVLSPDPDGRVAFEAAVDEPPKPGEPNDPHGGLHYALQSMHVEKFDVELDLGGPAKIKLHDVEGFVGVRRIESPGIRVRLEKISGRLEPEILGARTLLTQVNATIKGKEEHVAEASALVKIETGELKIKLDYFDREKTPVVIVVERAKGEGDLAARAMDFADGLFGDTLEVKMEDE